MKTLKIAFLATGIALSSISYAQTDSTTQDSATTATTAPAYKTFPTPNAGAHYIAVLGYYNSTATNDAENRRLTISSDEENPGKIWIEGLTDEKVYAIRKPSAGTYKIPAQKVGEKNVAEGTLIYDDETKEIKVCVGCNFKDNSPSDAFTSNPSGENKSKQKKIPVVSFNGVKADAAQASSN